MLGGGAGALAAAFALTDTPELRARHRVTVYQMGWRLGGKGASGRNRRVADRVEEHGLHVWGGFYENAFALLRRCYGELARPAGAPLATVDEAFVKHGFIGLAEYVRGRWVPWYLDLPENDGVPGEGPEWPTARQYLEMLLDRLLQLALDPALFKHLGPAGPALRLASLASRAAAALGLGDDDDGDGGGDGGEGRRPPQVRPLVLARRLARGFGSGELDEGGLRTVVALVDGFMDVVREHAADAFDHDAGLRRAFVSLDLLVTQLRGAFEDGAFFAGLDAIDGHDWLAWLRRHGASPQTIASPWVRALYDYVFGFVGGDTSRPSLSAAVAVRVQLLSLFAYKGAFFWKMRAGMGDAVFAPLYEVLRRRGVRFEFFHRVDALRLSADGRRVGRVELTRQATLREGLAEYAPLYDVDGLPCWPSEPLYEQLAEGAELEARGVNLETNYSDWPGAGRVELREGDDFDDVVFGIPVGSVPHLCADLMAASRAWREMVERVPTVATQSLQLWLRPTAEGLGRRPADPVIMTGYAQPFDTWSDMSQVLASERWPEGREPGSVISFC
ncbi:MAG TPA: NAD(P)-binding protein, partial [Polyangiaceae bacterium]|nr:NAD(P)-binding protein [Polyangiaceae bacterium]